MRVSAVTLSVLEEDLVVALEYRPREVRRRRHRHGMKTVSV